MCKIIFTSVVIFFSFGVISAQTDTVYIYKYLEKQEGYLDKTDNWTFEIPVWLPGYKGNYQYGDDIIEGGDGEHPGYPPTPEHPIEKPDYGNIFSRLFSSSENLKVFWGLRINYMKNRFIAQVGFYTGTMNYALNYNLTQQKLIDADASLSTGRTFMGYAVIDSESKSKNSRFSLYPIVGLRYLKLDFAYQFENRKSKLKLESKVVQPVIGIHSRYALRKWLFLIHTDYSHAIDEDSNSLLIQVAAHYRLTGLLSLKLGWDHMLVKYDTKVLNELFKADAVLSGPVFTIQFHL